MKFVLFVEGATEKKALPAFLKRWLDSRLPEPVGIQVVGFEGWPELLRDTPSKACMYLGKPDVIAVAALLDLYGPTIYPADKIAAGEGYSWGKERLESRVDNHPRFRQYFAVDEVEAWLLSDPSLFPPEVARALRSRAKRPEDVNFHTPPSKLLEQLYLEKTRQGYKKVTYGSDLFSRLDPQLAYSSCPHLKEMLDEMLTLATAALEERA